MSFEASPTPSVTKSLLPKAIAVLGVAVSGLVIPGGGIIVAVLLIFTLMKATSRLFKGLLVGLGVAILIGQIGVLAAPGEPTLDVSPATRVK